MSSPIPLSPSIGRWQPRPVCAARHLIQLPPTLFPSVKLLAFIREENLGNAIGRAIRRTLDEFALRAPEPKPTTPIELWPIDEQVTLLVPEKLRHAVKPDGRVPSPFIYGDRPDGVCRIAVPLSNEERITARIAAFGQLTSLACWGAKVIQDELRRLPPQRDLWLLPPQEQIELLLPREEAAWPMALEVMSVSWRATRCVPKSREPVPGEDFRLRDLDKVG